MPLSQVGRVGGGNIKAEGGRAGLVGGGAEGPSGEDGTPAPSKPGQHHGTPDHCNAARPEDPMPL